MQWGLSGNSNNSSLLPFQHTRRWTLGRAAVVGWCREHTNMKTLFIFVIHIHNIIGDFVDLYQVSRNMSVVNFDGNVTLETLALSKQAGWIAVTISQLPCRPPGLRSPLQHKVTLGWKLQLLQLWQHLSLMQTDKPDLPGGAGARTDVAGVCLTKISHNH